MELTTRRCFFGGLASAFALGPRRLFAAAPGLFTAGRPALTLGALSDLHVCLAPGGERLLDNYSTTTLLRALEWFRDNGVDAVVVAGDIAHSGLVGELKAVADAWFKVFPDDKAPDGRQVERIFVAGNHDWANSPRAKKVYANDAERNANLICLDPRKHWDAAFHEEWKPIFEKKVNGYPFVCAHWSDKGCTGHDEHFVKGLDEYYASRKEPFDPSRPFFHVQHPVPKGTVNGDKLWGQDDGVSTRILSAYPNAIAFSGHSHASLTDERSIWQGAFTSIGCASLRDVVIGFTGVSKPKGGFENEKTPKNAFAEYDALKAMEVYDRRDCRQGQLVRVYDDRIVFSRREFMCGAPLGDDLVMPLPVAEDRPFAFSPRREKALAPEFPKDAVLSVRRIEGKLRGKKGKERNAAVWELTVPAANAVKSARAGVYEVTAPDRETGKPMMFAFKIPSVRLPASDPRVDAPFVCRIACRRVVKAKDGLTFSVRAVSCWGKKSSPLSSAAVS